MGYGQKQPFSAGKPEKPSYSLEFPSKTHFFLPNQAYQLCLLSCTKQSYATWMPKRICAKMGYGKKQPFYAGKPENLSYLLEFPSK